MEILITSKTKKGKAACVGGIILANNEYVRLLNSGNWDQYADTDFNIGDVWDIDFEKRQDFIPPHIEDIIIHNKNFIRKIDNLSEFIINLGVTIFRGNPDNIFDGKLKWTNHGSGYINDRENLPNNSVGFWIADKDLILDTDEKHYIYEEENPFYPNKRFPYVGFVAKVKKIPAGTLLRISLARWWKPEDIEIEERCYLQLSGWYDFSQSINL